MDPLPAPAFSSPVRCAWHDGRFGIGTCAGCQRGVCDACATPVIRADGAAAVACPTCAPANGCPSSVPWEDPGQGGVRGFFRTFGWVYANPDALFRCFPAAGVGRALTFAWIVGLPMALMQLGCNQLGQLFQANIANLFRMLGVPVPPAVGAPGSGLPPDVDVPEWFRRLIEAFNELSPILGPLLGLLMVPVWNALLAVVYHVPALLLGARAGFGTTFRMVCYRDALAPLGMFCPPAQWIWQAAVMYVGFRRMHGLSGGRALVAAVVPIVLVLTCICGFAAVFSAVFLAAAGAAAGGG